MDQITRVRADWIVPVSSPPFQDGEIVVQNDRIVEVNQSPRKTGKNEKTIHARHCAVIPGLVNVHTHLDYTVMRGLIEETSFFPWIRELTARKSCLTQADWVASATMGAAEAVAGGVTTIGDCTDSGAALQAAKSLGLRGIIFQEVFGIDEVRSVETTIDDLSRKIELHRKAAVGSRLQVGVSPHSPYTVRAELFTAIRSYATRAGTPLCIHAAESQAEAELVRDGRGVIAEMFKRRDIQWNPTGRSTVAYLHGLGILGPDVLLVHGTQMSANDRHFVRDTSTAWAHCPKSNAKLGNGVMNLGLLRECSNGRAIRIGLGSDSVASNNSMDLFEEMRFAALVQRAHQRKWDVMPAAEVFRMATLDGAGALGLSKDVGSLEVGKLADLAIVRLDHLATAPCFDPISTLVYSGTARDVALTMIGGEIVYRIGRFPQFNLGRSRTRFRSAADKMRNWKGL